MIRTPTATITDLGTEFGVEVRDDGRTCAHVFDGKISLASIDGSLAAEPMLLHVGQSAESDGRRVTLLQHEAGHRDYVRVISQASPASRLRVIAHFRLGEDDIGAAVGAEVGEHTAAHAKRVTLQPHGAPRYTTDVAAPGSTLAVQFEAARQQYFACRHILTAETDNFGIEAWVKPNNPNTNGAIAWNGDTGWGLLQRGPLLCAHLNGVGDFGAVQFTPGQWHHIALVRERGKAMFYVNGVLRGVEMAEPCLPTGVFRVGCTLDKVENNLVPGFFFDGAIDEVRVFEFTPGEFRPEELLIGPVDHSASGGQTGG